VVSYFTEKYVLREAILFNTSCKMGRERVPLIEIILFGATAKITLHTKANLDEYLLDWTHNPHLKFALDFQELSNDPLRIIAKIYLFGHPLSFYWRP